jgi:death-on-curing protein
VVNTIFLTFEQVLAIHDNQIETYGGSHGLRDLALFESAIMRPQTTFGGKDLYPSIFEKAAVLMHSLIMNHPFVDGNKRTGTVSALVFLEINRFRIAVDQNELVDISLEVTLKKMDVKDIATWLEKSSKKI